MKKVLIFVTVVFLSLMLPLTVNAAEKEIEISLPQEYISITFTLTFEKPGLYEAYLIDPNGVQYPCSYIDESTMKCIVEKTPAGTWIAAISRMGEDVYYPPEEGDQPDEIGKVKVTAAATRPGDTNVISGIKVGKDITGLSIYFKNDNVVVEWTDINCGAVSVKVVNKDNNEVLKQKVVQDNVRYFECSLAPSVRNIVVSVVPSSSANIEGAAIINEYVVNNNPHAKVTFPNIQFVNKETVDVNVVLEEPYGLLVLNNGSKVLEEELISAGTYTYPIPLIDTNNDIEFFVIDNKGNMRSVQYSYIKDTTPPTLSFDMAYDGLNTDAANYIISGSVMNYDSFYVNGNEYAEIATDGHFDIPCVLHMGVNEIVLSAKDKAGNYTSYTIYITRLQENAQKNSSSFFSLVLAGAVLVGFAIYSKIKKKKEREEEAEEGEEDDFDSDNSDDDSDEYEDANPEEYSDDKEPPSEEVPFVPDRSGLTADTKEEITALTVIKDPDETDNSAKSKKTAAQNGKTQLVVILVVCLIIYFITQFMLSFHYITSESMEPTLTVGEIAISNRLAYLFPSHYIERGDVIFFKKDNEIYGKRVLGIAGDSVEFHDGYVFLNGFKVSEPYLDSEIETRCSKSFVVPEGYLFVLGDNREESYDSRFWTEPYVSEKKVVGKYMRSIPFQEYIDSVRSLFSK